MQNLSIPLAIIIAGALIAGAVYFANVGSQPGQFLPPDESVVAEPIRGMQPDDHVRGSRDARVVIVEFSDTECPYCKQFHGTLQQIMAEYEASGEVAWVYRHFPLEVLHAKASKEAEALECAAELGGNSVFWSYTDRLYEITPANDGLDIGVYNPPGREGTDAGQLSVIATEVGLERNAFEQCLASGRHAVRVNTDLEEAFASGGRGTPHSIIVVGDMQTPIEGAQAFQTVKQMIDAALER